MKIIIIGKNSTIGSALFKYFVSKEIETIGTTRVPKDPHFFDLSGDNYSLFTPTANTYIFNCAGLYSRDSFHSFDKNFVTEQIQTNYSGATLLKRNIINSFIETKYQLYFYEFISDSINCNRQKMAVYASTNMATKTLSELLNKEYNNNDIFFTNLITAPFDDPTNNKNILIEDIIRTCDFLVSNSLNSVHIENVSLKAKRNFTV